MDGLRQAGTQEFLVLGLLARAALRRVQRKFPEALADVKGAMEIAERGAMRLYQAEAYLESVRLFLEEGNRDDAREYLERAKMMIDKMGYHIRDRDVDVLEKVLLKDEA